MVQEQRSLQPLATDFAPYAPAKNVLDVITRRRNRGLPDQITIQVLQSVGVPIGNGPRTLQALRFLGLMRDDGSHTDAFDNLARASESEYPAMLAEVVRKAYDAVFTIVDPKSDGTIAVTDAFRQYRPEAQRQKMVTLFMGLCEVAEITDRPVRRRAHEGPKQVRRPAKQPNQVDHEAIPRVPQPESDEGRQVAQIDHQTLDYRLISAVMQQLPSDGKWTEERRRRWVQAVTAAVDLLVETVDDD